MNIAVSATWNKAGIAALQTSPLKRAVVRALCKAGSTALRHMRSEARKRITARKRIGAKYISRRSGCGARAARTSPACRGE